MELREKDGTFTVVAALPGVEAKEVSVHVSAEDVVISAASDALVFGHEGRRT